MAIEIDETGVKMDIELKWLLPNDSNEMIFSVEKTTTKYVTFAFGDVTRYNIDVVIKFLKNIEDDTLNDIIGRVFHMNLVYNFTRVGAIKTGSSIGENPVTNGKQYISDNFKTVMDKLVEFRDRDDFQLLKSEYAALNKRFEIQRDTIIDLHKRLEVKNNAG